MNTIHPITTAHRRPLAAFLLLLAGVLLLCGSRANATAFTVNTLTDTKPTLGGAGSGTTGDLRYCISQANAAAVGSNNTITFTVTGTITLAGHELVINSNLTITGPGSASLTVDANMASRVVYIAPGRTASISGLTMTKGIGIGHDTTGIDSDGNGSGVVDESGGAILNNGSVLTVTNCTFTNNAPSVSFDQIAGGAIYNIALDANATLTVNSCTITGNSAGSSQDGGGIRNNADFNVATLNISQSTISNNTAGGSGGGIANYGSGYSNAANLTISNCTISGNVSNDDNAGGIFNQNASSGLVSITNSVISGNSGGGIINGGYGVSVMKLLNCIIADNTATGSAGGIENSTAGAMTVSNCTINGNAAGVSGGGILNSGNLAALSVNNCTIIGNSAQKRGGGIYNASSEGTSTVSIANSTICGNTALTGGAGIANDQQGGSVATATLSNTILALNPTGGNYVAAFGTGVSNGFNLSDDGSSVAFLTKTGDRNNTAAGLQVDGGGNPLLLDNGGPTQTVALLTGSAAMDGGKAATDPLTNLPATKDQRGNVRPVDIAGVTNATGSDGSDIGAFELGTLPLIGVGASPVTGGTATGGGERTSGASATVVATANPGYFFVNWTENGTQVSTSTSYTFTVSGRRTLIANFSNSADADLASLVLSTGTLSPAFAASTTGYTASVPKATTSVTITPTVSQVGATLKLNGTAITSGVAVNLTNLSVGPNLVSLVVTAPNGIATKTYSLSIVRGGGRDFNGDGFSDLVFQNTSTGQVQGWFLDGTGNSINFGTGSGIKSTGYLYGGSLPGWQLAGIADVNSDGIPDLIFQNTGTGQVQAWLLDGTGHSINFGTGSGIKSTGYLYGGSLPGWQLVGIADVNSDGIPDLIFQNTGTGQVQAWLLDGTGNSINFGTGSGFKSTGYLYGGSLIGWRLAAIADVNGDGIPDLIFQNTSSGQVQAWMLDGTGASINFATGAGFKSTGYLYGGSLPGWRLAGIYDVNGDGIPDLLFQNTGTGQVQAWFLDGTGASINFTTGSGFKSTGYLYGGSLIGWQLH